MTYKIQQPIKIVFLVILLSTITMRLAAQPKLRVAIAGLNHDHIHNILHEYKNGKVDVIGIVEPEKALQVKYAKQYQLSPTLFYTDLKQLLTTKKVDVVLGYNAVSDHLGIVQVCAPLGIPVMVEKPLAATLAQAQQMEALAIKYKVKVLTNYETTWYPSYHDLYKTINQQSIGKIRKMVVHDGHQGPKEINCSPEFVKWLTDPVKNGAGAMNDFGCYGADLMTWLMKGQKPVAVTAITRHYKPEVYPLVDDDATILVEYPEATGIIEASWSWPFSIKDLEVFGETGYLHALDQKNIFSRKRENTQGNKIAEALPVEQVDPISYLTAVLRNKEVAAADLSSLQYNMIVMEILDAAKRSAKSGKRIVL